MSTPKLALSELREKPPWPIYFLYGEEPYKIQEFIDKVQESLFGTGKETAFCIDRLDGAMQKGPEVLDTIQSLGLFGAQVSSRRLVVVKNAHLLKETEELLARLASSPKGESPWGESVLILFAESLDGRKKFHQWLKKNGYALEFQRVRDAELPQWIDYLAKKKGCLIEPDATQLLAALSEGSLWLLSQELEKAWLHSGAVAGKALTKEDVAAVTGQNASHEMIELVEAVLDGKKTRALFLSEHLIQGADDALGFVGFLTWMLKKRERKGLVWKLVDLDQRLKSSGLEPQALVEEFLLETL